MPEQKKIVYVDPNESTREELSSALSDISNIRIDADCSRYEFFGEVVKGEMPHIAIVNIDADPDLALRTIENTRSECPTCSFLVISESTDSQSILKYIRAGSKEYINYPFEAGDLEEAFDRMEIHTRVSHGDGSQQKAARVIVVTGSSGGVGSTSIAANLAAQLATEEDRSVVLMDLDLALGDADIYFDIIPEYTLSDMVQNISRLDESMLEKTMSRHKSGLFLLPRPVQLQEIEDIRADSVRTVIELLKENYTDILIDTSKAFTPTDIVALTEATDILMVPQLDLRCLRNVVRLLSSFEEVEGLKEKVKVVINRAGLGNGEISLGKAKETIGTDIFAQVPNDYRNMVDVRNNGVPLCIQAPKAGVTQAIQAVCEKLEGEDEADGEKKNEKKRWLGFLPTK